MFCCIVEWASLYYGLSRSQVSGKDCRCHRQHGAKSMQLHQVESGSVQRNESNKDVMSRDEIIGQKTFFKLSLYMKAVAFLELSSL